MKVRGLQHERIQATPHEKDNIYKTIFAEPELFIEFLENFISIDILKNLTPENVEDITERFMPLFSDNNDSDTVKKSV